MHDVAGVPSMVGSTSAVNKSVDVVPRDPAVLCVLQRCAHSRLVVAEGLQRLGDLGPSRDVPALHVVFVQGLRGFGFALLLAELGDAQKSEDILLQLVAEPTDLDPDGLRKCRGAPKVAGEDAGPEGR